MPGHTRRALPLPCTTATPNGPKNSNALAVPNGMRSNAAMNSMVTDAVTTPSATHARKVDRVNAAGRGRTMTSMSSPAQASRSQAAPSTPMRSIRVTAIASPTCTDSIDPIAMKAPVRAWLSPITALNVTATVHVHVIFLDIPFDDRERCVAWRCGNWLSESPCGRRSPTTPRGPTATESTTSQPASRRMAPSSSPAGSR